MITQYKDSLCTIGIIVALIVISYFITKLMNSRERFTSEEEEAETEAVYDKIVEQKFTISKKVSDYINEDTDYIDYLKFLQKNGNVSYKLIDQDVFYEMRILAKMDKLTRDAVYSYIKDEK